MKITFVTSTLTSGGSERVMSILANGLCKNNHQVEILCLNKHLVYYSVDERIKLYFIEEETNGGGLLKKIIWLRKHVKESQPDVVIPFMEAVYCVTLLSLIGLPIPVISSERIDPRKSPFLRNILRCIFLPLTTHLVVQTNDIKSYYPSFIQKKTTIIYNPVEEKMLEEWHEQKLDRIINVGRLYPQKNQKMLIDAFAEICNEFPSYQLYIFGDGPERPKLEQQITDRNLTDRVFLPGRSSEIAKELAKSRLFCLSSDYEGMSNAVIEALCIGLPVISTDVSGTKELIHTENGIVVGINDKKSMVNALKSLLANPQRMNEMSRANRNISHQFKKEEITLQWENLIEKIVRKHL